MRLRSLSLVTILVQNLALSQGLPESIQASLVAKYGTDRTRYLSASTDLSGDGQADLIVHVLGPSACGSGGCPTLVFTSESGKYRLVSTISVTQLPVSISSRSSHGWRNLIVSVRGGGAEAGSSELEFNGKSYPTNPTVPPARRTSDLSGSTVLIRDIKSFEEATPLTAAGPQSVTPSFDCSKASSPTEKLICSDKDLAAQDRKLSEIYQKAIQRWTDDGVAAQQRTNQRNWITARNRCGSARDCVESSYKRRVAEVQIQSGQLTAPKPVDYTCQGLSTALTASFYNQTDPPSAVLTMGDKQVIALVAPSGSGAKYTAPGVEFWEHQGEAAVKWSGSNLTCKPRR